MDTTVLADAASAAGATPEAPLPGTAGAPSPAEQAPESASPAGPPPAPAHAPSPSPALPPEIAERLRRAEALEQQLQQLQLVAAEAQRQQAQQRLYQHIRDRLTQAYQTSQSLPVEEAAAFMTRSVESLTTELLEGLQALQQQQAEQVQQVVRMVAAPAYAHHLARQYGLPEDAVEELQRYAPEQMDQVAQTIRRRLDERKPLEEKLARLEQELEQMKRGQMAQQVAASGAHTGGGTNAVPVMPASQVEPGSLEHLASLLPPRFLG